MRKIKFDARFTLKENILHARLIVTDENEKIIFDSIGKTAPIKEPELKKLPSNETIIALLNDQFKQGLGDVPFIKVVNNLE
jgi:hypothetical protein